MTDLSKLSDVELQALYRGGGAPAAPVVDLSSMSDADLQALHAKTQPQGFMANALDFAKSIPRGLIQGLTSLPNPSMVPIEDELAATAPAREAAKEKLLSQVPAPQGRVGQVGEAVGASLGNPMSYVGPGGLLLKLGGAALSGAGGEGSRQAAEGTILEKPAQIVGALAGGVAAAKTLGPGAPKAAVPTSSELFTQAREGYKAARSGGLEVHPDAVSGWAAKVEQELVGPDHGFTGGPQGVAPKTIGVLGNLQAAPPGAVITASNLDAIRKNLGRIAEETQPAQGGFAKPTPDAAAATIALQRLNAFTEDLGNLPPGAVLAGDAAAYVRATREANANWAAGQRVRDLDTRLTKAENAAERQVAGSLDSQIKIKAGQLLDNPQKTRGLTADELAQLKLINSGDWKSNILRQAGRGGAGVIPVMGQIAAAGPVFAAAGPVGLAAQGGVAAALYGARKGAEAMTKGRAKELVEMLAKRSPEYERRVRDLPQADTTSGKAALIRALLGIQ